MFIHDSEHSYQTMMMEISLSWKKLSKGGYIICDDYKKNNALRDFSKAQNCRIMELGSFGVIKKTSARN
jgi:cephalosporin hydroxylase